jgi:hypothetical protein
VTAPGKPVARSTERLEVMGRRHGDGAPEAADLIGQLDHLLEVCRARYGDVNPERVRQLADHLRTVEQTIEALHTEVPYVDLTTLARDDLRRAQGEHLLKVSRGEASWPGTR